MIRLNGILEINLAASPGHYGPLLVTTALAGFLLWETLDLNRSMQWIDHTDQVLDQSGHLLQLLVDMESRSGASLQPATRVSLLVILMAQSNSVPISTH